MPDRFDSLSPRDTAITLRSLPRRIGELVEAVTSSEDLSLRIDAHGPSSRSLSEIVDEAARTQGLLHNELDKSLDHDDPVVSEAALDTGERHYVEARPVPVHVGLASLQDEVDGSAERVEKAQASSLSRTVRVVGGTTTTPLAVAREAARSGISSLQELQEHTEWMRRTRPSA